ncbi:hypothetical protein BDZ94DRAFT_1215454 [Collybia nuda]|uniref:Uncharacterized protein n=1 Tax=Collybia nuda TaxID=64659 RepID=A0A9P5YAC4_9AGAR|nr:hypothetical protein BDZ94DRAFT_1215454 [Collybia nuda]
MFSPTYYRDQGTGNTIIIALRPNQFVSSSVPFEIQGHVSKDVWTYRIPKIIKASSRYSKPRLELLWTVVGLMASLILPVALHKFVLSKPDRGVNPSLYSLKEAEARSISFGIFAGLVLFFLVPMIIWKFAGNRQMKLMLQKWSDMDRINSNHKVNTPIWRVKTPRVLMDKTTLIITVPHAHSASSFHPNAYLPSYLNGPVDSESTYFYPYKPEPGLPRMSTIGNVPLYLDEKQGFNKT